MKQTKSLTIGKIGIVLFSILLGTSCNSKKKADEVEESVSKD